MSDQAMPFDRAAAIRTARTLVERLRAADVRAAYLFGSVAWGDADAASDLDIGLILDRPRVERAVVRARVTALLPDVPPGVPAFADLAYQTVAACEAVAARGDAGPRLAHAIILHDTAGWLAGHRARAAATYAAPAARAARWRLHAARAAAHRAAGAATDDAHLAALHARLALEEAVGGLIVAADGRLSLTHFLTSGGAALRAAGLPDAPAAFRAVLDLTATAAHIAAWRLAYRRGADVLGAALADPALQARLPAPDRAWAAFTLAPETFAEMDQKVVALPALGRGDDLQYYLDGTLTTVIRMNLGKVLQLRAGRGATIPSVPAFHAALHTEPALLAAWTAALRLDALARRLPTALALADAILARGTTLHAGGAF